MILKSKRGVGVSAKGNALLLWNKWANEHQFHTNAPGGIYSGEAFEEPVLQFSINQIQWYDVTKKDYAILKDDAGIKKWADEHGLYVRLFIRLKPSHLPAVLTTQPGEEWKDRYREVWEWALDNQVNEKITLTLIPKGSHH
jgi:hypothetical protein